LTALEVIGFSATHPTELDKYAYFGQQICYMQQIYGALNFAEAGGDMEADPPIDSLWAAQRPLT
jgi:hypothetical protein